MGETAISWTQMVWNPVRGCSRVSAGCVNCYAERQAHRFSGPGQPYEGLTTLRGGRPGWTGEVRFVREMLAAPLHWRKPRRVFVNSMSDLFHERVTNEQIAAVFGVMAACQQHTFQVLTKRPERMVEWFKWIAVHCGPGIPFGGAELARELGLGAPVRLGETTGDRSTWNVRSFAEPVVGERLDIRADKSDWNSAAVAWPLPNVWLGVSVEDQRSADERIPHLLGVPAAVRFVSAEPLLEAVTMPGLYRGTVHSCENLPLEWACPAGVGPMPQEYIRCEMGLRTIHWVIAGGESGTGARSCAVEWLRSLVRQCKAASVPIFVKQLGANYCDAENGIGGRSTKQPDNIPPIRRLLDRHGADMAEWPPDLRVREFPGGRDG